jgi:hypothetical protein
MADITADRAALCQWCADGRLLYWPCVWNPTIVVEARIPLDIGDEPATVVALSTTAVICISRRSSLTLVAISAQSQLSVLPCSPGRGMFASVTQALFGYPGLPRDISSWPLVAALSVPSSELPTGKTYLALITAKYLVVFSATVSGAARPELLYAASILDLTQSQKAVMNDSEIEFSASQRATVLSAATSGEDNGLLICIGDVGTTRGHPISEPRRQYWTFLIDLAVKSPQVVASVVSVDASPIPDDLRLDAVHLAGVPASGHFALYTDTWIDLVSVPSLAPAASSDDQTSPLFPCQLIPNEVVLGCTRSVSSASSARWGSHVVLSARGVVCVFAGQNPDEPPMHDATATTRASAQDEQFFRTTYAESAFDNAAPQLSPFQNRAGHGEDASPSSSPSAAINVQQPASTLANLLLRALADSTMLHSLRDHLERNRDHVTHTALQQAVRSVAAQLCTGKDALGDLFAARAASPLLLDQQLEERLARLEGLAEILANVHLGRLLTLDDRGELLNYSLRVVTALALRHLLNGCSNPSQSRLVASLSSGDPGSDDTDVDALREAVSEYGIRDRLVSILQDWRPVFGGHLATDSGSSRSGEGDVGSWVSRIDCIEGLIDQLVVQLGRSKRIEDVAGFAAIIACVSHWCHRSLRIVGQRLFSTATERQSTRVPLVHELRPALALVPEVLRLLMTDKSDEQHIVLRKDLAVLLIDGTLESASLRSTEDARQQYGAGTIDILLDARLDEPARALAEKHGILKSLARVCFLDRTLRRERVQEYYERFGGDAFAVELCAHIERSGSLENVLSVAEVYPNAMETHLQQFPRLLWVHRVLRNRWDDAAEALWVDVQTHRRSLAESQVLLALSALARGAEPQAPTAGDVNDVPPTSSATIVVRPVQTLLFAALLQEEFGLSSSAPMSVEQLVFLLITAATTGQVIVDGVLRDVHKPRLEVLQRALQLLHVDVREWATAAGDEGPVASGSTVSASEAGFGGQVSASMRTALLRRVWAAAVAAEHKVWLALAAKWSGHSGELLLDDDSLLAQVQATLLWQLLAWAVTMGVDAPATTMSASGPVLDLDATVLGSQLAGNARVQELISSLWRAVYERQAADDDAHDVSMV